MRIICFHFKIFFLWARRLGGSKYKLLGPYSHFLNEFFTIVEHFVSNLLPAGLGPVVCGSHVTTMWIWYTIITLITLNSHSGYHFPFLRSAEAHDYHHLLFNQVGPFTPLLRKLNERSKRSSTCRVGLIY